MTALGHLLALAASVAASDLSYTVQLDAQWRPLEAGALEAMGPLGRGFAARLRSGELLEVRAWRGDLTNGPVFTVQEESWAGPIDRELVRRTEKQLSASLAPGPRDTKRITVSTHWFGEREGIRIVATARSAGGPEQGLRQWRIPGRGRLVLFSVLGSAAALEAMKAELDVLEDSLVVHDPPPPPPAAGGYWVYFVTGTVLLGMGIGLWVRHVRRRTGREA